MIASARIFRSRFSDPWTNLAIEDWLLRHFWPQSAAPQPILYLWRNQPCVVIGRNQNPWKELNLNALRRDNVPWIRRQSGGGTVYHDMGNACYTIIMARQDFDLRRNADLVNRALHQLDIPSMVNDRRDLVIHNQILKRDEKISGSAYRLIQKCAFHHGTMLIDTDLERLRRYLRLEQSRATIDCKAVQSVRSPVTRLRDHSFTADFQSFCESVTAEFSQAYNLNNCSQVFDDDLIANTPQLQQHIVKYRDTLFSPEWHFGHTPDFTNTIHDGEKKIRITVNRGTIKDIQLDFNGIKKIDLNQDIQEGLEGCWYEPTAIDDAFSKLMTQRSLSNYSSAPVYPNTTSDNSLLYLNDIRETIIDNLQ